MSLFTWLGFRSVTLRRAAVQRRQPPRRATCRPHLEPLEERCLLASGLSAPPGPGYLLVGSYDTDQVLRYDGATGAFVDDFVPRRSGGLNQPNGLVFGPHDHNLYVTTGHFQGPGQIKAVLRFDGTTGAFLDEFVKPGQLTMPHSAIFGPDGNLYVGDRIVNPGGEHGEGARIARFDGRTGDFLDNFVPLGSGGLTHPIVLTFGPDGSGGLDLYASDEGAHSILRYDGTTGAFRGAFVHSSSGGLGSLTFGPDGNLYVTQATASNGGSVLRFQGPSGETPGAFLDVFIPPGYGGLLDPGDVLFGPDSNGDGRQDVYVSTLTFAPSFLVAKEHTTSVKVYDGVTGAYLRDFVTPGSGGLDGWSLMSFTETDPVTRAYTGGMLRAVAVAPEPMNDTLRAGPVQPLLSEALARWQGTALATSRLSTIDIRIADLPGATLAQAMGHTIWLDVNAAGWGWFVDPTPANDSEFTTPGNQGEQHRMDLLTVLEHELGHLLGYEHTTDGVMAETLAIGTRRVPSSGFDLVDVAVLDRVFSDVPVSFWS